MSALIKRRIVREIIQKEIIVTNSGGQDKNQNNKKADDENRLRVEIIKDIIKEVKTDKGKLR